MVDPFLKIIQHKPLEGLYNLRDLGGYAAERKQVTCYSRYLRGDLPGNLPPKTLDTLLDFPLLLSIDLRSANERASEPSSLSGLDNLKEIHIPLIDDEIMATFMNLVNKDSRYILGDFYIHLADHSADRIVRVFKAMAAAVDGRGSILFHCAQGKDRTGVIAALLLKLCGVSDTDIVANYQVSYTYLRPKVDPLIAHYPANMKQMLRSDYWNMERFLLHFSERHGFAEEYLLKNGLTPRELNLLKQHLLDA